MLDHLLAMAADDLSKPLPSYSDDLLPLLAAWNYPGNVRELAAKTHDAVARNQSGKLSINDFALPRTGVAMESAMNGSSQNRASLAIIGDFPTLKEGEDFLIEEALKRTQGNQGKAAALLGIARQSLNRRLVRAKTSASCPAFQGGE